MPSSEQTPVCMYLRYSSSNQSEQSIEGQMRVCKAYCKAHDLTVVATYIDRATSASKHIEKRLDFQRMIQDSAKNIFQAVVVYKLDRFARNRYDSANFKYRLKKYGVRVISATENISDNPESIILESVLEGMAEFYSAELSQKIKRGMYESAHKHAVTGGKTPLGYKSVNKQWVIDPATAPIVKEAFRRYASGETVAEICRTFNDKGYRSSTGAEFNRNSFKVMLRNERYMGVYKYGDYRQEGVLPAIVDRELFEQVQTMLKENGAAPSRGKAQVNYLLSGKIFCGHCGQSMNGESGYGHGGCYNYYTCYGHKRKRNCDKKPVRKESIEQAVVQDALQLLTDDRIEELAETAVRENERQIKTSTKISSLKSRVEDIDRSLKNITAAVEKGTVPESLLQRMVELEQEKKDTQTQIAIEEKDVIYLDKPQVIFWLSKFKNGDIADENFQRRIISLFVNSVTVYDLPDGDYKITIAYNLTSERTKTYRVTPSGQSSVLGSYAAPQKSCIL